MPRTQVRPKHPILTAHYRPVSGSPTTLGIVLLLNKLRIVTRDSMAVRIKHQEMGIRALPS